MQETGDLKTALDILNEAFLYGQLSHPNIVNFKGVQFLETSEDGLQFGKEKIEGDAKFY